MKKNYWFKGKRYGWGWYPSSWQGWGVLLGFIALILWNSSHTDASGQTLRPFILENLLLVVLLIVICYRTGEPPKWRWGEEKTSNKK
jgi:hypothetical protein